MAAQDDEIKSLTEKNNELVQKVQYWKITAAQRENEKLELLKEINELRLKVIRLKSGGAAEARKLDAALQSTSEQALSHLVQASGAIARSVELAKTYLREREGAGAAAAAAGPRWSSISSPAERVHRVPPMMIGGQSIQPVVSLSRAAFNVNNLQQTSRSPNSSRNVTVRAVPMHMLQDVYIPLTRIDMRNITNNNDTETETANDSGDNIPFDTSMEDENPQNMSEDEDFDTSRGLDMVTEDVEPESEESPPRRRSENPLEGPSWLLDAPPATPAALRTPATPATPAAPATPATPVPRRAVLEPDSTTADNTPNNADTPEAARQQEREREREREREEEREREPSPRMFTPTVRRRKRSSSPPREHTPTGAALCSRVLQVLVPKLPAPACPSPSPAPSPSPPSPAPSPVSPSPAPAPPAPRRRRAPPRFDAPSPNGATQRVFVSEEPESEDMQSGEPHAPNGRDESPRTRDGTCRRDRDHTSHEQDNCRSHGSQGRGRGRTQTETQESSRRDSGDSDSDAPNEGRTRRKRKPVVYKEKPLNRKLRR